MKKYVIGLDFGTLSARCVVVDTADGTEIAESVMNYPHGVMDEQLPSGETLPHDYALQHPEDYLDVLRFTVRDAMARGGVKASEIVGMGIDFTACTLLPVDREGVPLCTSEKYKDNKHAYVKLWKHHAAQPYADEINRIAAERGEGWLGIYGGKISCEWTLPKILEILREAPEVYADTYRFTEAADWLSAILTGEETHSAVFAGYKGFWNAETGYPSNDFMTAVDKGLDGIVGSKISPCVLGMDKTAGTLSQRGAELTGLEVGTAVALPMIDGHAAMPALGITDDSEMMLIVGTSACHILNSKTVRAIPGICGYVKDGVIPGYFTYEAGQAAVGDIFDWFVKNCTPAAYTEQARSRGISLHKLLREKAKMREVGQSGLVALDWWNGNRSILVNSKLSGLILGMSLQTKPEDIYRALIEATAYGLRVVVEQYERCGISIGGICASGGIALKDEMMMQIYADVLDREIRVAATTQAAALGSAVYASVAAGVYPDVSTAAKKISKPSAITYSPIAENVRKYDVLYEKYKQLHDYFGKENLMMEELR